jgi:hypothetical protein
MNAVHNPMLVQFWLWGLDAARGDLLARGFEKSPRPDRSECSVYRLENLYLHGFGLWLEVDDGTLVYRRPLKTWALLPRDSRICLQHFSQQGLAWCDFARPKHVPPKRALHWIRSVVLEHEYWVRDHHGEDLRQSQLAGISSRPVKRAKPAWHDWFERDA